MKHFTTPTMLKEFAIIWGKKSQSVVYNGRMEHGSKELQVLAILWIFVAFTNPNRGEKSIFCQTYNVNSYLISPVCKPSSLEKFSHIRIKDNTGSHSSECLETWGGTLRFFTAIWPYVPSTVKSYFKLKFLV